MDLPGIAISDFHFKKAKTKLFVHDTFGPKVEMPISVYFREWKEMPELEKKAINLCSGKVLDIGAGAGSHALELQKTTEVTALEISPNACEVMRDRGVKNVICEDIFKFQGEKFDTLLLLMNGIGLCGDIVGLRKFLRHARTLLEPGGRLIFDSCDIIYMYEETPLPIFYYGEVQCKYEYADELTSWFKWLYIDSLMLSKIAKEEGWKSEVVATDNQFQYLVVLKR